MAVNPTTRRILPARRTAPRTSGQRRVRGAWTSDDEFWFRRNDHPRHGGRTRSRGEFGGAMERLIYRMFATSRRCSAVEQFGFEHAVVWRACVGLRPPRVLVLHRLSKYAANTRLGLQHARSSPQRAALVEQITKWSRVPPLSPTFRFLMNGTITSCRCVVGRVVAERAVSARFDIQRTASPIHCKAGDHGPATYRASCASAPANFIGVARTRPTFDKRRAGERTVERVAEPLCALLLRPLMAAAFLERPCSTHPHAAHDSICALFDDDCASRPPSLREVGQIADG